MPVPALVRTIVPIIVGTLVSVLTTWNITLDEQTLNSVSAGLAGVFAAVYYALVLLLESRWPWVGVLLGSTARPSYTGKHRKGLSPATATPDAPDSSEVDRQLP